MKIRKLNGAPLTRINLCNRLKNFRKMILTMIQLSLSITVLRLGQQTQFLQARCQLPAVLTMVTAVT